VATPRPSRLCVMWRRRVRSGDSFRFDDISPWYSCLFVEQSKSLSRVCTIDEGQVVECVCVCVCV
jgi:hypothetical protein